MISNDIIFDAVTQHLSLGDTETLKSALLHSASWQQNLNIAYGDSQLNALWLSWFRHCGLVAISELKKIDTKQNLCAMTFSFTPDKCQQQVRALVIIEHNSVSIKRVEFMFDTQLLADSLQDRHDNQSAALAWLPAPDPLQLCDLDQQLHPHTTHAAISDLLAGHTNSELLDEWWQIWQSIKLDNILRCYHNNAQIFLPGRAKAQSKSELFSYVSTLLGQLRRHYCQLVEIIAPESDANTVVVKWHIEGDYVDNTGTRRVRLNMYSHLQLGEQEIIAESVYFDQHAFNNRYPNVVFD